MARTIAEIQDEILDEKNRVSSLNGLTTTNDNTSKTSIWKLWTHIVATAIWIHEKIVERNALISRPHTLNWYQEQALKYIHGKTLTWKDGSYQFDIPTDATESDIESAKIIKHCAVSEVDLGTLLGNRSSEILGNSSYLYNNLGVVHMKVANDTGENIKPISTDELNNFREYIARIKDAGNQVIVDSLPGDELQLTLKVYVDPLLIDIENVNEKGKLIGTEIKPVEEAIKDYLKNLEFNGAFVKTFLVDAIQKAVGVKIPILEKAFTKPSLEAEGKFITEEYSIPKAGYFDLDSEKLKLEIEYVSYTFYREY
ncbi:MAG: hypothetical protein QM535_03350 [Limnohabitans sp.]|nr:hypothetical protein [Limnohabitans sp.]